MRLYNTLTRKIEDFNPGNDGYVKLYTCGPTVYHYAHIGNLRNVIFNDTLKRSLTVSGYEVNHVMNITDVGHLASDADEGEDKLEKGAAREGKTVWEVAEFYTEAYSRHTKALNVLAPSKIIRATDAIPAQVSLIQTLMDKSFVYQTRQAIYFDTTKLEDYGKLSGQKLSDKEIGVRSEVVTDSDKYHPQDFALWFFTVDHFADHQMRWESPWGEGFPGWHLECSAIIHESLGEPIDIHTGGIDHIGTHHTNEIAQSEVAYSKSLANFWMHNEFLLLDGNKMSKSGDQTITLNEVIEHGFDPMTLRLLYLQSHYRTQANFSWDNLEAAQSRLKKMRRTAELRHQITRQTEYAQTTSIDRSIADIKYEIINDLNTPKVLETIASEMDEFDHRGVMPESKTHFIKWLEIIDSLLGLNLILSTPDITKEQKDLISKREDARKEKNWPKSDELRDQLIKHGIGIKDAEYGAIWYRV